MRRTLTREFMIKRIDALRPAIARLTDELLTDLTELSGPADFVEHFALPLPPWSSANCSASPTRNTRSSRSSRRPS